VSGGSGEAFKFALWEVFLEKMRRGSISAALNVLSDANHSLSWLYIKGLRRG